MADDEDVLRVTRSLAIPHAELTWRFSATGGPGGQHANTANTKAEVRFDIAASPSLGPRQRERLLQRFGPEVRVTSTLSRSQARNRQDALARLSAILAGALRVERPRVATRPTRAAAERRLAGKHRHSTVKRDRRRPTADD